MKAAYMTAVDTIELREIAPPTPGPREVLVRVAVVGLCGSDLSYLGKGANGDFVVRAPFVLGHEIVGVVVARGEHADGAEVGDRVAIHPAWPCPPAGSSQTVDLGEDSARFLGSASTWPHTDGGLRELIAVRAEQVRRIPDGLDLETAALAEPTAVVLHALSPVRSELAGANVLVCGTGPIGLLSIIAARSLGAHSVTAVDLRATALDRARTVGADHVVRASEDELPGGFDIAVEATGSIGGLESALEATRPRGAVVQLGMLPRDARPARLSALVTKELRVFGTHRFVDELDAAVELLASSPACADVIGPVIDIDEVNAAFAALRSPDVSGKVLVRVGAVEVR